MKKCSFCGELNPEKTLVCPWCGHPDPELITDKNKIPKSDPRTPTHKNSSYSNLNHQKKPLLQNKYFIFLLGIFIVFSILLITLINQRSNLPLEEQIPTLTIPTFTITPSPEPTVIPTLTPTQIPPQAVVVVSSLKIRNGPGTDFLQIGYLKSKDIVNIIGRDFTSSWIKIKLKEGGEGWISSLIKQVKINYPINQLPLTFFRPLTGKIQPLKQLGKGECNIDNNSNYDAIVLLTRNIETLTAVYVRSSESYTIKGIPSGDYFVYFSEGTDWNGNNFNNLSRQARFRDVLTFENNSYSYTIWSITLNAKSFGNAPSIDVNNNNFPSFTSNLSKEE